MDSKTIHRAAIVLIIGCSAVISAYVLYAYDHSSLIFFGDAVSHIVRSRQFIDSLQPGIHNIGTVWLPLPHLLLLPFVAFDTFFYSGIAGAIIGIPLLVGTGLLLFSILETLTHSRSIALLFALLFALNPNILYIALTPMNEISLLFFIMLAGYFLLKWIRVPEIRWMILCSIAVTSATLCRYEAWLLAPYVSVISLVYARQWWERGDRTASMKLLAVAAIGWSGIIFWFVWNYVWYGDALMFAHWTYSVGTTSLRDTFHDRPQDVFVLLGTAVLWIFGPAHLIAGGWMLVIWKKQSERKDISALLIFFSLPALFVAVAVMIGFVQIDRWWWNWRFVLSYGVMLSVAGAMTVSMLFQKIQSGIGRSFIVGCFLVMPVLQMTFPDVGVAVFNDASKSYDVQSRSAADLGNELHLQYEGGSIALFTGYGLGQRMMITSLLPIKLFNVHYSYSGSIHEINDRYIIIGKESTSDAEEFSGFWPLHRVTLLNSYSIITENDRFVLLRREYKTSQ